jgi:short-subunit dehydrogenase
MADTGRNYPEKYGEWALVTGASAGIGLEFARALAREGMSIVLTARREDRLNALAAEIKEKYRVNTRVVAVDLAAADGADRLADAVADLPIAFLVNNAGFGYAGRFDKLAADRLRSMVVVNCLVPVVLTSRILPAMVKRGRGAVIIVGSVAGRQPLPLHAVYSATKGFDLLFGEALWGELRGTGVDVLVIEPGPTRTEFQSVAGEQVGADHGEPPENVVRVALDALGKHPSVISGWFNWVRANATRLVPRSTAAIIAKKVIEGQTPQELR